MHQSQRRLPLIQTSALPQTPLCVHLYIPTKVLTKPSQASFHFLDCMQSYVYNLILLTDRELLPSPPCIFLLATSLVYVYVLCSKDASFSNVTWLLGSISMGRSRGFQAEGGKMAIMVRTYYQGSAAHPTHHRNVYVWGLPEISMQFLVACQFKVAQTAGNLLGCQNVRQSAQ